MQTACLSNVKVGRQKTETKHTTQRFGFACFTKFVSEDILTAAPNLKLSPNKASESQCSDSEDEALFLNDLFTLCLQAK